MKKALLAILLLACIVFGQEGGEPPEEGNQPTESPLEVTETEDGLATTLSAFTLETDPDTTFEPTTSAPSTTTTVSTTSTTTVTTSTTTTTTKSSTTTTSSEVPTTFEATVGDIVMGEEEGQDLDEEEEGVVKEIEDGETEVLTKTADDNGFGWGF